MVWCGHQQELQMAWVCQIDARLIIAGRSDSWERCQSGESGTEARRSQPRESGRHSPATQDSSRLGMRDDRKRNRRRAGVEGGKKATGTQQERIRTLTSGPPWQWTSRFPVLPLSVPPPSTPSPPPAPESRLAGDAGFYLVRRGRCLVSAVPSVRGREGGPPSSSLPMPYIRHRIVMQCGSNREWLGLNPPSFRYMLLFGSLNKCIMHHKHDVDPIVSVLVWIPSPFRYMLSFGSFFGRANELMDMLNFSAFRRALKTLAGKESIIIRNKILIRIYIQFSLKFIHSDVWIYNSLS